MNTYDAHGLPYFISSSGVMQLREACYTAVSYAPYMLLQIYTIKILATFGVTIFDFFHPGPQPNMIYTLEQLTYIPFTCARQIKIARPLGLHNIAQPLGCSLD